MRLHVARGRQRCLDDAHQFISICSRVAVAGCDRNLRHRRDENAQRLHVITACVRRRGGGEEGVIVRGLTFRQVLSRDDRSEGTIIRAVCLGVVPASDYRIQNSVTLSTDCRNSCAAVRSLNPSQTSDYQK